MLWAIDIGNTQTVVGVHDGTNWVANWRFETRRERTEDELAGLIASLCSKEGIPFQADRVVIASVVPQFDQTLVWFAEEYLRCAPIFLREGSQVGLKIGYEPPTAVGADRIANAIAALELVTPPLIVVDFGTATTLDAISREGEYLGGSILPGILVSMESLISRTAKLPGIALTPPDQAIGRTTPEALQSGIVLGYAGAVDRLVSLVSSELGGDVTVLTTGGLGKTFVDLCDGLDDYYPMLTLDGLLKAAHLMTQR